MGRVNIYQENECLGQAETIPDFKLTEFHIHEFSTRVKFTPLIVFCTIFSSPSLPVCKVEVQVPQSRLNHLHMSCVKERKTAVMRVENNEFHLVAMSSNISTIPCFWCYSIARGLYDATSDRLESKRMAIVFDLDKTLVRSHALATFNHDLDILRTQVWSGKDTDVACLEFYRLLLEQYSRDDIIIYEGKTMKSHPETAWHGISRPIIRFEDTVLTRIDPQNRQTSMVVRLRPGWEHLRSYLTTKEKKFDVYVCTHGEKDYASEIWRLLDPEGLLIAPDQLPSRLVCVKPSMKKSLLNVFANGTCLPKMALVIDDRLDVWEDRDGPRVHAIPAFNPYHTPKAEMITTPALHVARDLLMDVRDRFFQDFDDNFISTISGVKYEDQAVNLPPSPDTSNYLQQLVATRQTSSATIMPFQAADISQNPVSSEKETRKDGSSKEKGYELESVTCESPSSNTMLLDIFNSISTVINRYEDSRKPGRDTQHISRSELSLGKGPNIKRMILDVDPTDPLRSLEVLLGLLKQETNLFEREGFEKCIVSYVQCSKTSRCTSRAELSLEESSDIKRIPLDVDLDYPMLSLFLLIDFLKKETDLFDLEDIEEHVKYRVKYVEYTKRAKGSRKRKF